MFQDDTLPVKHRSRLLSGPLRQVLAQELSAAINQAIYDLPRQEPRLKQIEIVAIQDE